MEWQQRTLPWIPQNPLFCRYYYLMEWFQDWTSWAWLILIALMVILEGYTLVTRKLGDTLSEHIRRLLGILKDPETGVRYKGGLYTVLRALFLVFFVWFIVHILFNMM